MCVIGRIRQQVDGFRSVDGKYAAHIGCNDQPVGAANDPPLDPARYLGLVHRVARRVARSVPAHISYGDLVGAGTVGLLEAATRFEPSKGRFGAFAEFRIRGAIMDELRRYDLMGRNARLRQKHLDRVRARLTSRSGRPPSETEMAEAMQTDVTRLRRMQEENADIEIRSLEQGEWSGEAWQSLELATSEPAADHAMALTELRTRLAQALSNLSERRQRIVRMYYQENLTLKEIGVRIGISESRVCQILGETTRQLRMDLTTRGAEELVA